MTPARTAAVRIATGSGNLLRQFAAWLMPGTVTDTLKRATGALVLGWFLAGILYAAPALMWAAAGVWILSAAAAGTPPAAEEKPAPVLVRTPDTAVDYDRAQLLTVLDEITRGRSGIHLVHLWPQMRRARPAYAGLSDTELRALLAEHGVPITRSMTVDRVAGRSGVKRADVERLLTPPPPLSAPLSDRKSTADLHDSRSLSPRPEVGEGVNESWTDAW